MVADGTSAVRLPGKRRSAMKSTGFTRMGEADFVPTGGLIGWPSAIGLVHALDAPVLHRNERTRYEMVACDLDKGTNVGRYDTSCGIDGAYR
jgi:hypothetical protein